jgi:hypothetical protein
MRKEIGALVGFLAMCKSAHAGFDRWTTEVEKDPFSGGTRVTVDLSTSIRSGVIIFCDSSEQGVRVRIIPGYEYDPVLEGETPTVEFAIDGTKLLSQEGYTGSVGANLAVAEVGLTPENSRRFIEKFAKAESQVAIKDGISDRPALLTARGSTKAGAVLSTCINQQQ